MTSQLNEYCLHEIFQYLTPLDWVHMSEVCRLWKTAVSRMWTKVGNMHLEQMQYSDTEYQRITGKEAKKVVLRAAPFITFFASNFDKSADSFVVGTSDNLFTDSESYFIRIGLFNYQVMMASGVDHRKQLLQRVAIYSTNLTEVDFDSYIPLEAETLEVMFNQNNIKRFNVEDAALSTVCESKFADKIEELSCRFYSHNVEIKKLSHEHFSNLQKLKFELFRESKIKIKDLLVILRYVSKLKSLTIRIFTPMWTEAIHEFEDIYKVSQIEELKLEFLLSAVFDLESFLRKLREFLPQLRVIKIRGMAISSSAISVLSSFPNLETLLVSLNMDFSLIESQKMNHLTKFYVDLEDSELQDTFYDAVLNMLEKMPKLQLFGIEKVSVPERFDGQSFELVLRVINHILPQGRTLIVTTHPTTKDMTIEKPDENGRFPKRDTFEIRLKESETDDFKNVLLMDRLEEYLSKNMGDIIFVEGDD